MRHRRLTVAILAAALAFGPATAIADLAPASGAFEVVPSLTFPPQVDPGGGAGDVTRSMPVVASSGTGFAVVWVEESLMGEVVIGSSVRGRLVGTGGALGEELEASPSAPVGAVRRVACPSLAGLGGGRFLLAFAKDEGIGRDLWLQRFGPGAAVETTEALPLASDPRTLHDLPFLGGNTTGRAAVAWQAAEVALAGTVETTYHALSFDAAGEPMTVELALGPGIAGYKPLRPAIAVDRAGRFTAAWLAPNPAAASSLWVQSFAATGVPLGAATRVGTLAVDGVAVARSGPSALVVWARKTGTTTRLRADRVGPDGRRLAAPRELLSGLASFASPTLVPLAGNEHVLAWLDGDRLRVLHLGADLAPRGSPLDVAAARPDLPLVRGQGIGAAVSGSRLLLAWAGALPDGLCPANAILGQLFDVRP